MYCITVNVPSKHFLQFHNKPERTSKVTLNLVTSYNHILVMRFPANKSSVNLRGKIM